MAIYQGRLFKAVYLIDYKKYYQDCSKKGKSSKSISRRTYNKFHQFCRDYSPKNNIINFVFMHLKQTEFIEEKFETESGDEDKIDNTFSPLSTNSIATKDFMEFYEMVLKTDE